MNPCVTPVAPLWGHVPRVERPGAGPAMVQLTVVLRAAALSDGSGSRVEAPLIVADTD